MTYRIKAIHQSGETAEYTAIGDRDALMDAAYAAGALGVSILVLQ